ncbi:MAG: DUF1190 domain-containing protein [Rhodospirillales bacterium]|nr:DUF1190 domain-containing protein [Rhodospirillales bacterium]
MKRSKSLKLFLMGATALTLVACDEPQDVAVFENTEQCARQDGFDQNACETSFKTAQAEHIRVAPKYTSAADCEVDFGAKQCEVAPQRTSSGGGVFMPMMMGYMMGSVLSGGTRGGARMTSQPLYRSADDPKSFRTGDNHKISGKTGLTKVASNVARAPSTKTSTIRRGGFGATASKTAGRFRSYGG